MKILLILFNLVQCHTWEPFQNNEIVFRNNVTTTSGHNMQQEEMSVIAKINSSIFLPDWNYLDHRTLPEWYDRAKIGILIHWGLYSVPSFSSQSVEWFWAYWKSGQNKEVRNFVAQSYPPGFTYQDFAPMFKAEFFNPKSWAKFFKDIGAKYVILTSKHHDGFELYRSKQSVNWNSVSTGPHRDLVQELSRAVRRKGLKFGIYYSLYEWFNPMYIEDEAMNFTTYKYRDSKVWPDIKQLVNDYKPSVLWADGDWENTDTYFNSTHLLAWLYNESPIKDHVVVNDRWGKGTQCKHGDFYTCADNPGILRDHKWESGFSLDVNSWGFRRNMKLSEVLTTEQIIMKIVKAVSCGGNALINIGPTKDGTIPLIFQDRLLELGKWLQTNGEAIYGTSPWLYQGGTFNSDVWYTCKKLAYNALRPTAKPSSTDIIAAIYIILLKWPNDNIVKLKAITMAFQIRNVQVIMLGHKYYLFWKIYNDEVHIWLPDKATVKSNFAWSLKVTYK